jgi:succinyldiaminopimelate transaminase
MFNPRVDRLIDYPFQRLRALLDGLAPPADVAPLIMSIGEPQHAVPALVPEALAATAAGWGKYPPPDGTPEWRAAVAGWLGRRYGLPEGMINAETDLIPVSGTREALYMAGQVIFPDTMRDGSRPASLIPNPFYQVYIGAAVMNGAHPVLVDAPEDNDFLPDFAGQKEAVLERSACMTLCSPANPQGTVAGLETWTKLVTLARAHDMVLIADECYSEIYRDNPPTGVLEACRALGGSLDNVLVFNSLSKRSSVPGLRSGFVTGDREVIARFRRLRSYGGAGMPLPVMAAAAALWSDETHVEDNRALYRRKMADAEEFLGPRFGLTAPPGGFFLWLDVGAIGLDGETATRRLWSEAAIKVLPGAYLAQDSKDGVNIGDRYVRIALVHDRATTRAGLERIAATL